MLTDCVQYTSKEFIFKLYGVKNALLLSVFLNLKVNQTLGYNKINLLRLLIYLNNIKERINNKLRMSKHYKTNKF